MTSSPFRQYTIAKEPRGFVYRTLITFPLPFCSELVMVVNKPDGLSEYGRAVQQELRPFLIQQVKTSEWPGTILLKGEVALFRYRYDAGSAAILARVANRLYEWLAPKLPEDRSLLRPNGRPWLVVISHERDAYIDITDEEKAELMPKLPNLRIRHEQIIKD
jgi:hypothetical protein